VAKSGARTMQRRGEDLFAVDVHGGLNVVEEAGAEEESFTYG